MSFILIDARNSAGEVLEVLVDRVRIPRIGDEFEDEGERYTRILSRAPALVVKRTACQGYTLPRKHHAIENGQALARHYDDRGIAQFETRAEINEYMAKANDNPNDANYEWNPDGGLSD